MQRLGFKRLALAFIIAVLVFAVSLIAFPENARSFGGIFALACIIIPVVVLLFVVILGRKQPAPPYTPPPFLMTREVQEEASEQYAHSEESFKAWIDKLKIGKVVRDDKTPAAGSVAAGEGGVAIGGDVVGRDKAEAGGDMVGRDKTEFHGPVSIFMSSAEPQAGRASLLASSMADQPLQPVDLEPVQLRLDAAVPDQVLLARAFELAVAVRQIASAVLAEADLSQVRSGGVVAHWPTDRPYVDLRVRVSAPDCDIHGDDSRSFKLWRGQDSPVFYFHLTPRKTGEISIVVSVFQADVLTGGARVHTVAREELVGQLQLTVASYAFAVTTSWHYQS